MLWTRLYARGHPFPAESDAVFKVNVLRVVPGKTEVSFGAALRSSAVTERRVIGHGAEKDVGISFYDSLYRHGGGIWFQDGQALRDNVSLPVVAGSEVVLRWTAESRTMQAELDDRAVGCAIVPPGDYILGATCEGPGTVISAPRSFTYPALVLTAHISPSDVADCVAVKCTNLGGDVVAEVALQSTDSAKSLREIVLRALFMDTGRQQPCLRLLLPDCREFTEDLDEIPLKDIPDLLGS